VNGAYATLISEAAKFLAPYEHAPGRLSADVAAIVVNSEGKKYSGVCIDTPVWGICAERTAASAAVTAGSYVLANVVAVWRDPKTQLLHVLPPCGGCRQFLIDLDRRNLNCQVILGLDEAVSLKDLMPRSEWPEPLDSQF
jgi:cytidine deaminase